MCQRRPRTAATVSSQTSLAFRHYECCDDNSDCSNPSWHDSSCFAINKRERQIILTGVEHRVLCRLMRSTDLCFLRPCQAPDSNSRQNLTPFTTTIISLAHFTGRHDGACTCSLHEPTLQCLFTSLTAYIFISSYRVSSHRHSTHSLRKSYPYQELP